MLEDIFRMRRDMKLFMVRALKLSEALESGAQGTSGSSSIGYDAMAKDFFQIGKVFNNYLARIDKELEDIPDPTDGEDIIDALTEIKGRVDEAKSKVSYVAHLMGNERREGESDQDLFDRLSREYSDLTNQIMRGMATDEQKARQQKLTIWNVAA